jgi:hypothetical protein
MSKYINGINEPVARNCAERQERWKKVDAHIQADWDRNCDPNNNVRDDVVLFDDIWRGVLNDPTRNEGLTVDEFVELALGCGCCFRHSHGLIYRGHARVSHVSSWNRDIPTTKTVENKPCDCRCRHNVRGIIGALYYAEIIRAAYPTEANSE